LVQGRRQCFPGPPGPDADGLPRGAQGRDQPSVRRKASVTFKGVPQAHSHNRGAYCATAPGRVLPALNRLVVFDLANQRGSRLVANLPHERDESIILAFERDEQVLPVGVELKGDDFFVRGGLRAGVTRSTSASPEARCQSLIPSLAAATR